jgi:hypothetical protein
MPPYLLLIYLIFYAPPSLRPSRGIKKQNLIGPDELLQQMVPLVFHDNTALYYDIDPLCQWVLGEGFTTTEGHGDYHPILTPQPTTSLSTKLSYESHDSFKQSFRVVSSSSFTSTKYYRFHFRG